MLPGEIIEKMKTWFIEITLARDMNLKVIWVLPTNWQIYAAMHPMRPDFNKLTSEELFGILIGNEDEIFRIHRTTQTSTSKKPKVEKKEKEVAFKAISIKKTQHSSTKDPTTKDKLLEDVTMMALSFERLGNQTKKYKIYYRDNKHNFSNHN